VLVMEAPLKSGALITATYANEFNRDVYALPGKIDDQPSQGCLKLISQGAGLINHELNELLIMLGAIPQIDIETETPLVKSPPIPNLAPELQQIINILAVDALSFDFIIQKTGMNAAIVSSSLLQLELMGLVTQLPGMRYQKC
ncbi:DNA-processing protein DprA, partial [Dolichospermum circinale CS-537/05]|nr:DNA-processing protein DprA [Dolichospermum circinale CS-537/05]